MEEKLERFKSLLKEIFEVDKSDLNFGIYRIINLRKDRVESFINNTLPKEINKFLDTIEDKNKASELASDIYSALYNFFSRYYDEGDFISKRRYKEGVYAIPYEGEEVKLYWANYDQYYIKTSEDFKDYEFKTENEITCKFRLIDVTTEQNNNKEKDDEKRKFMLYEKGDSDDESIETFSYDSENKVLTISFIYDIPKDKNVHIKTEDLEDDIKKWVESNASDIMLNVFELQRTNDKKQKTLLGKHLEAYIAKNTFDYFIHKDLKGFLDRELDFFIKSEVMHLEDLNTDNEKQVDSYLLKVKAIKKVGEIIIDFLASVENFQKKLWLKKKFIIATNWCISLDKIDESFYDEIRNNKAQVDEWIDLYAINEVKGFTDIPNNEFLKRNMNLVVDTKNFTYNFKERLLATINELDKNTNGILINGDNFHALKTLEKKYKNRIQLSYTDPPYNTGKDGFCYKDKYFDSSWCCMIKDRYGLLKNLLTKDATVYVQIDYYEKERLKLILNELYCYITEIIWRIGWISGYKSTAEKFIRNHDTIYQFGCSEKPLFNKIYIPYPVDYVRRDGNPPDGKGYPMEDTWNCYEIDKLDSIQIMSFCKEKVGDKDATQKNENLIERMILCSSNKGNYVIDFFAGTGSSFATAYKMGRKPIGIEMSNHQFYDNFLPRAKKCLYGDKFGISEKYNYPHFGIFKYFNEETYEDALSNIILNSSLSTLFPDNINYMMDLDTKDSLLNVDKFKLPFDYKMRITAKNETKETNIDIVETFNYLIGLTVQNQYAVRYFKKGRITNKPYEGAINLEEITYDKINDNTFKIKEIHGLLPDGRKAVIIWRDIHDDLTISNAVLDAFYITYMKNKDFDVLYINGDNNVQNLKKDTENWKTEMIEPLFNKLMFEEE